MDQFTRRIVGFGIHRGIVDESVLCRMFKQAIKRQPLPKHLSTDNDPLYRFHQWEANLRVLDVTEIKTVPYVPLSHPFVERLIGTIRRECLDRTFFWTTADLEAKLLDFQYYYNGYRTHAGLGGRLPEPIVDGPASRIDLASYRWLKHCRGLYQTPRLILRIRHPHDECPECPEGTRNGDDVPVCATSGHKLRSRSRIFNLRIQPLAKMPEMRISALFRIG